MRQYENINKIVMMENEAAYKKVSQERENVHRLMKTTFDPAKLRMKQEAEKLIESVKTRYQSHDARTPYKEGSPRAYNSCQTPPSQANKPLEQDLVEQPALSYFPSSRCPATSSLTTRTPVENPRYEDFLKKRIQTKIAKEGEIKRLTQLASPGMRDF